MLLLALALAAAPEPDWRVPIGHATAVVGAMRLAVSVAWPAAYDPLRLHDEALGLKAAFTQPPDFRPQLGILRSDGDPWAINVFGHGAFGSEIYLRARQCGHGALASLAFTAGVSAAWEYVIEGAYKRPSAIDLTWTPIVGGLLLGEARYRLFRATDSRVVRALVDPFGEIERAAGASC